MMKERVSKLRNDERKSEQAHIPHAPTFHENAAYVMIPGICDPI